MPFTHLDSKAQPHMVDVTDKAVTRRSATAQARVRLTPEIMAAFDGKELQSKKGPVFHTAILAGIQAAKKTSDLIPLCHPLPLTKCSVSIEPTSDSCVEIRATAITDAKTGVEMEALSAVSGAALTLYDMCKAISKGIVIEDIRLLEKTGGKSGDYHADAPTNRADTP
ncbi:cyclic pyranopterin monophosphate synthase MoaC [Pelagicoccus sp. SDUM812003]|uniref:cyclic pyranopterin monophosphate synthase MoaC n=1 Tax=Pelagicoccus sp. SDUM812003 TaxID=3041267 RepID=UPI00280C820D|nr:cyclic pyranopterin monophosphate synthase MoaC [Pelagicoccus sp. SDUM812003]MDQ8202310.1 cyclic pyranopterin monophosphate synthase MoaC [Pelagicoccus sp. SDUM812003]